ncbi:TraR/DksA family transcriptional regulator [Streptomyces misionensis]|uniref:TraR/DksA family transcriptional regulator n=1 Tax=Streptomyces misionensis TaxID=67331 RepID=UPI0036782639
MVAKKTADKAVAGETAAKKGTAGKKATPARKSTAAKPAGKAVAEKGATVKPFVEQPGVAEEAAGHPVAKKAAAKKAAAKKAVAGKTAAEKAAAGKATAEKAAEKRPGKRAAAEKTEAKDVPAKDSPAKDDTAAGEAAAVGSTPAEKAAAGKTAKAVAHEAAPDERSTAKKAGAARAAEQTGATTVVAKKTPGTAMAEDGAVPKARAAAAEPGELAVRPGEDPWTGEEVAEARAELQSEMERLRAEISSSEASLVGLMRDSGDGAGDDQADTGTKNITREHELALAANAREMLVQTERALERLDAGTYGLCENCGRPIGKARMQAFPRATLCVECKQKQERRS